MGNINTEKAIRGAIKQGDIEKVKALIGDDIEILNMVTVFGTWLHVAATQGKLEITKYLIEMGLDINIQGGILDCAAIKSAVSEGHIEIVKYLLECGAELDVSEPTKNPLFGAIYGGHKNIVELLVEKGIDITVKYTGENMKNMDAYAFAIERGQMEIAEFLKVGV